MTREEREQAIWHDAYMLAMSQDPQPAEASNWADAAVAAFRKRYPAEPTATPATAPEAVWYDEPPFEKNGEGRHCWVECVDSPQAVYWSAINSEWRRCEGIGPSRPLAGRRVCPITKPPEPTQ